MWYMNPVKVTVDVPHPTPQVFDFLDVMRNHEPFTNHMLQDWEYSGPDRGVGSKARVTVKAGGRSEKADIEVIAAERPTTIVEQNVSASGKRIGTGTYTLEELPGGHTRIAFEYAWRRPLVSDRVAAPLIRAILRRGNQRAMERLAEQLALQEPAAVC